MSHVPLNDKVVGVNQSRSQDALRIRLYLNGTGIECVGALYSDWEGGGGGAEAPDTQIQRFIVQDSSGTKRR